MNNDPLIWTHDMIDLWFASVVLCASMLRRCAMVMRKAERRA